MLATARVCRCNPWNAGGVDHVPPKGSWKSEPYVALESHDLTGPVAGTDLNSPAPDRTDRSAA